MPVAAPSNREMASTAAVSRAATCVQKTSPLDCRSNVIVEVFNDDVAGATTCESNVANIPVLFFDEDVRASNVRDRETVAVHAVASMLKLLVGK